MSERNWSIIQATGNEGRATRKKRERKDGVWWTGPGSCREASRPGLLVPQSNHPVGYWSVCRLGNGQKWERVAMKNSTGNNNRKGLGGGRRHGNSQMMMVSKTWRVGAHVLKHHFLAADGMAIFITTLLLPSSGSYRSPVIFKGRHADQTSGRRSPITTDPNAFISSLLSISSALPTQQIYKKRANHVGNHVPTYRVIILFRLLLLLLLCTVVTRVFIRNLLVD